MANEAQIKKELAKYPQWRDQPTAFLNPLVALWADVPAANLPEKIAQAAYRSLVFENAEYREAFQSLWNDPVCEYWEYESDSSEHLLTQECVKQGLTVTTENLEKVWPTVMPKLSRGRKYDIAEENARKAAAEQRAHEARKKLRELLLEDFVESFETARRRDGDIQQLRNIGRAKEREEARLASLTAEQLLAESQKLTTKFAQQTEAKRLQNAPLSWVQQAVRNQSPNPPQAPRQAYRPAPGQQFKPLPPDYNGKPWTVKTLERAPDLRRLLRQFGPDQINEAVALNKSKGVV
jgi:hypothetical protein